MAQQERGWIDRVRELKLHLDVAICVGFGTAILAVLTWGPTGLRGYLVVLCAFTTLLLFRRRKGAILSALVVTLVLSEDTSNRLAEVFDRAQFGSVWAASIIGRVTASDALALLAVALGSLAYRHGAVRRISIQ
ncbi:MAG TPA: hypothetical protein VMM78_00005, partial [Thermomicrobiales bacterium]|nr:hypothetical protein [Thermomicrobiales bacterium]